MGRIEECDCAGDDCLVALPANEFFDDDCIHDPRSALGAFMQHYFRQDIPAIQALVRGALAGQPTREVDKKPGERASSYGIGACAFLANPLSSPLRVAMVSVTTQRADMGLCAEASYVFEAASSLQRVMVNHRLTRLHLPVLGSGHGGLQSEVSLLCMLIAFGEMRRKAGHSLKEVNIVVYRGSVDSPPAISEATIKGALEFAGRYLAP